MFHWMVSAVRKDVTNILRKLMITLGMKWEWNRCLYWKSKDTTRNTLTDSRGYETIDVAFKWSRTKFKLYEGRLYIFTLVRSYGCSDECWVFRKGLKKEEEEKKKKKKKKKRERERERIFLFYDILVKVWFRALSQWLKREKSPLSQIP